MKGPEKLDYFNGNWPTNKGAWFPGEKVLYRDKELFDDFSDKPWIALLMYGVRGVMPDQNECIIGEHIWKICTSYPDPRIWNNRVSALAGTSRSSGALALSAATAVSEASIYGRRPDIRGAEFLSITLKKIKRGEDIADITLHYLKKHRSIPGFGRPLISKDERIGPLLNEAEKLQLDNGEHLLLIPKIESVLNKSRYRLQANISLYCAALMLDQGYSPREFYMMALIAFTGGILPCYLDGIEKPEGVLFPLLCHQINYSGFPKRGYKND